MSSTAHDTKEIFWKKGTCSQALFFLLNREFGYTKQEEERASDLLAGGLLTKGCQCGMLWGASLAAGTQAFRRFGDSDQSTALAVTATQDLMRSFCDKTNSVNCNDITGYNMAKPIGFASYLLKSLLGGGIKKNVCFNLAEKWVPEAIATANESLSNVKHRFCRKPLSCASETAKRMGASREEMISVAGFAGGMGLSGEGCGALGAAVWMKMLTWIREHPGKSPAFFNNKAIKKLFKSFREQTGSDMLCREICGRKFDTLEEHTEFVRGGGCEKLIDTLARA